MHSMYGQWCIPIFSYPISSPFLCYPVVNPYLLISNILSQSWARIPAGPSRDARPRSFISYSRSAFPRAFSELFFRIPKFAFPRSCIPNFVKRFSFTCLTKKNLRTHTKFFAYLTNKLLLLQTFYFVLHKKIQYETYNKYNITICRLLVGPLCKAGVARIEIRAVTISPAKLTN